ncbi:MAG: DUF4124 domain-containing protein [Endozoicomonas sp.]
MKITMYIRPLLAGFSIGLSLWTFQVKAAIYKTVDENGNVVFSDTRPSHQSSEEVKLRPTTPMQVMPVEPPSARPPEEKREPSAEVYSRLEIIEPVNDQTVRTSGNFAVKVATTPKLQPGHKLRLLMDGNAVEPARRSLDFTLLNVDRGTHVLTVEVVDQQKNVVRSSTSTVHVQRAIYKAPGIPTPP